MRIGVDYYPEHWDKTIWEADACLMEETGVSLVRLAEFAWCRLEPREGDYSFGWLDEAIAIFGRHGIQVVLGTPTATPPNWLVEEYPDLLPVDHNLHPIYPGVRCHRCYNSPSLRKHTRLIIEKLTAHYSQNPVVIGWQTDNEFGLIECHCRNCQQRFREWLRHKYETLEKLNREWGTIVWSGEFNSWEQIKTPLGNSPYLNPSFLLDYYRFCTDSTVEFQNLQIEIIRRNCPDHFVTHNIWGYPVPLDYYKLFEKLDFVSHDYYPDTNLDEPGKETIYHGALSHDLVRGVKQQNFWVMEQLSGTPGCWDPMSRTPYPGMIRAYAWQGISRGADAIIHFRWRSACIGAEQFWHGLIDHSNIPGRRFVEFAGLCQEVKGLANIIKGTTIKNEVAILHCHEQYTAFKIQPQVAGMDYFENLKLLHRAFLRMGVGTDVIHWTSPFNSYKLVVAPSLYLLDQVVVNKLTDFVKNGGTLILTNRSGVKNLNNVCWMKPLPGLLAELAGVVVEEYDPVGLAVHTVKMVNGKEYQASQWCDILRPTIAQELGWYNTDFFKGRAAVTVNHLEKGQVYYIGSNFKEDFYYDLCKDLVIEKGMDCFEGLPAGVEVSIRQNEQIKLVFVLNLSAEETVFRLPQACRSVFGNKPKQSEVILEPFAVEIFCLDSVCTGFILPDFSLEDTND